MFDQATDASQPVRVFSGKTGPDDIVEPEQSDAAARTQINRCVEGSQIGRREREHDDAEKRAVLGVDPTRYVDRDLMRDPADHRLADENSRVIAVEVNADVLAIAEVDRLWRGVEGGRDELAVGADDGALG